ncbi:Uncharacterised protein [Legionella busanensis]|uniref:Uncharacterized protein n=1 Tax=Legionella busanensis TaxID=190655 RepID=A0A378JK69_9GAMM|nr:Uncharacterised protein [Legionella busanensis]
MFSSHNAEVSSSNLSITTIKSINYEFSPTSKLTLFAKVEHYLYKLKYIKLIVKKFLLIK